MSFVPSSLSQSWVRRLPIFYGWLIWGVAALGLIATAPAQAFSISLFVDDFMREFALDRTTISTLFAVGTFIAALSLTWVGHQLDRYGNRRVSTAIVIAYTLAIAAMAWVSGAVGLLLLFIALRGLGQGALWLTSSAALTNWFRFRRGRVLSIALVLFALFQGVYVPFLQGMLAGMDWRTVWLLLAVVIGVVMLPLTILFMRDKPEDFGLLPDNGYVPVKLRAADGSYAPEQSWRLREAMRTPIFWVFLSGRVLAPGFGSGLVFHQVSIFAVMGYGVETVAATYALIAFITAGVSLLAGALTDRGWLRPGAMMALILAALILSMIMAMSMQADWMLLLYALGFGVLMGMAGVFDGAVWANLFGRQYQGEIRGFTDTVRVGSTAIGPILFGLNYDANGDYTLVLLFGVVISIVPMLLALSIKHPMPQTAEDAAHLPQPAVGD